MPDFLAKFFKLVGENSGAAIGLTMVIGIVVVVFFVINMFVGSPGVGALFFALLFLFCALLSFAALITFDLMNQIGIASRKIQKDGRPESELYATIRAGLAEDMAVVLILFCFAVLGFYGSTYNWSQVNGSIFTTTASAGDVGLFTFDILLKGALFDIIEHYHGSVSPIALNYSSYGYCFYSLIFRLYVSLIFIGSAIKILVLLGEIDAIRRSKDELTKFISFLPDGDA
ncbi:hypothetical protein [Hyphomicrobium sp.]|uniref:hypothetical protein n=1 Tax=Hyphomicrobium sp. TaxID=82 RepID=UPI0025BD7626|nr:hypothetical protein [Hyphomicrobium sp.]MCC7251504.1 hypothetical protein [Hyphomicrobium sp.]